MTVAPILAVPFTRQVELPYSPLDYFARLTDGGRRPHGFLLESADLAPKYGERSLGSAAPCLRLTCRGPRFSITALNETGMRLLHRLDDRALAGATEIARRDGQISGAVQRSTARTLTEAERLRCPTPFDLVRAIAGLLAPRPPDGPPPLFPALFLAFGYDAIDAVETLPPARADPLGDPDIVAYLADHGFVTEHLAGGQTRFVANALVAEASERRREEQRAGDQLDAYVAALATPLDAPEADPRAPQAAAHAAPPALAWRTDQDAQAFGAVVETFRRHIVAGDIFQGVPSRSVSTPIHVAPLEIYKSLRALNPSPYMFFVNFGEPDGVLLGASPEMCVRVGAPDAEAGGRLVEIRPIAGTKPRGLVAAADLPGGTRIDPELDSRHEVELKTDFKELAEHTMLIDLARNDVARVSVPGTRVVDEPFVVEKYSHVQHLVSSVRGILRPELDALHAYVASMNMGTLTGAPKLEAMALIRRHDLTRRGFYGGAVGVLTPAGALDTCIVIRSMRIKAGIAYLRAGAGIVFDSDAAREFAETENKLGACVRAIEAAHGLRDDHAS